MKIEAHADGVHVSDGNDSVVIEARLMDRAGAVRLAEQCASVDELRQRLARLGTANE